MKVLLTNDDGVGSAGIEALCRELSKSHELHIVAPSRERSGTSHAITFRDGVTFHQLEKTRHSCTGTPADCVLFSLLGAVDFVPDIVISGINHGANLGTDIIYSGTVAAARQAALMSYPGIAVSLVTRNRNPDFTPAALFVSDRLDFLTSLCDHEHLINVNVPDNIKNGWEITVPSRRTYQFSLIEEDSGGNGSHFKLRGEMNPEGNEENTDWAVTRRGAVSISPVNLYPVNRAGLEMNYSNKVSTFITKQRPIG